MQAAPLAGRRQIFLEFSPRFFTLAYADVLPVFHSLKQPRECARHALGDCANRTTYRTTYRTAYRTTYRTGYRTPEHCDVDGRVRWR